MPASSGMYDDGAFYPPPAESRPPMPPTRSTAGYHSQHSSQPPPPPPPGAPFASAPERLSQHYVGVPRTVAPHDGPPPPRAAGASSLLGVGLGSVSVGTRLQGHRSLPSFTTSRHDAETEAMDFVQAGRSDVSPPRTGLAAALSPRTPPARSTPSALRSGGGGGSGAKGGLYHPTWECDDDEDREGEEEEAGPQVHEKLLEKGRLLREKKEALREAATRKELAMCKEKPSISKNAQGKQYTNSIYERTMQRAEQKKRDRAAAVEAATLAEEEEARTYSFKPQITKRGKLSTGRAKDAGAVDVQRTRQLKMQSVHQQQVTEELKECCFSPEINARSAKLAARQAKTKGHQSGPSYTHADSLMERSQVARVKTYLKHADETEEMQPHNPCISQYAARLRLDESVTDRLYRPAELATPPSTRKRDGGGGGGGVDSCLSPAVEDAPSASKRGVVAFVVPSSDPVKAPWETPEKEKRTYL
eukprot:Rhum_TRINITY_DN8762_c0_g2::Rhum_TRINITY_DN8762_c0_g2_i1::g.29432::m.29432